MIDVHGRARRTVDIPVTGSPMMHDFSLTEKYVVIYDLPVTFDPTEIIPVTVPRWLRAPARLVLQSLAAGSGCPVRSPRGSTATRGPSRRSRSPGTRTTRRASACCRARPTPRPSGGSTSTRATCSTRSTPTARTAPPRGAGARRRAPRPDVRPRPARPGEGHPTLDRWEIDLSTGAVRTERRDDRQQEFPRINETLTGAKHRYGYTVGLENAFDGAETDRSAVYKQDFSTGGSQQAALDPELLVGEMSFVPNPGATAEDDGVLMGYGHHLGRDEGQLLMLDAATLETVATVHLPQRVPMGFHGNWCADE